MTEWLTGDIGKAFSTRAGAMWGSHAATTRGIGRCACWIWHPAIRPADWLLHALDPFDDRAGDGGVRGIGRHDLGDVAVILVHDIGWAAARLAELVFQGRSEERRVRKE